MVDQDPGSGEHGDEFDSSLMTYDYLRDQIPATLVLLGMVCIVGSLGNGLVIYVYARKTDKQTANLFILVLAVVDFFTCVIIIPFTMVNEKLMWRIGSNVLCKVYHVLNTSNVPFSSLLISAIAVDRYFCICHPFLRAMTVPRAKAVVLILAIFSLSLGSMAAYFAEMIQPPPPIHTTPAPAEADLLNASDSFQAALSSSAQEHSGDTQAECADLLSTSNWTTTLNADQIFFLVIHKANHVCFGLCILCVLGLYILIYRSILMVRRKRKRLLGRKLKLPPDTTMIVCHEITLVSRCAAGDAVAALDNGGADSLQATAEDIPMSGATANPESAKVNSNNRRRSLRGLRETQTFQNMKTAAMLFVVAVVFIVTFSPAILMANRILSLNLYIFYMYYLNNAANPIIYGFMNKNFRQDVKKLFVSRKQVFFCTHCCHSA